MKFVIYKLRFKTEVHFGNGRLSSASNVFFADTLFSALCHEAVKCDGSAGAEKLFELAKNGELLLSDGMPYQGDLLLIPKPIVHIEGERESDSSMKKKFKKLKYIPITDIRDYMSGSYDPSRASETELGRFGQRIMVAVHENADNEPFRVGVFSFENSGKNRCGLYFIARVSDEADKLLDRLMTSLSYTGLGGKVSAGLGKFEFERASLSKELEKRLSAESSLYMSLSISMAADSELDELIGGAWFEMIKRSGFVASTTYSDTPVKKTDLYCFKGGSCFTKRFDGEIFDVGKGGAHPVYRYAKPLLIAIGKEC